MSYSPTFEDIKDLEGESPSSNYVPSLQDISAQNNSYAPHISDVPERSQSADTLFGQLPLDVNSQINANPKTLQQSANVISPFLAPEFSAAKYLPNVLARIPGVQAISNALGRIGYGTALTAAPELETEEGRKNLPQSIGSNLKSNAILEGLTWPLARGANALAEVFNPINYARDKAMQIKREHDASKAVLDDMYAPINEQYGQFPISVTPEKYLKEKANINRNSLYSDAKDRYDDFINEPSYKNLQELKSQIGRDWARVSQTENVGKTQLFNKYQRNLDNRLKMFLGRDVNALNQYNLANQYATNVYYPYLSTKGLRSIAKGNVRDVYPKDMSNSLNKALGRRVGAEQRYVIPSEHPLNKHAAELNNRIKAGEIAEISIPALTGMILGERHFPGVYGPIGGAVSGAGLGFLGSKLQEYPIVQSPLVQNIFRKLESPYYNIGRSAIISGNQGQ